MNRLKIAFLTVVVTACTQPQKDTVPSDSTVVAELDSSEVFFSSEKNDTTTGHLVGTEYFIQSQQSYVSDPFDFTLDSSVVAQLLGPDVVITSRYTPGGEDEEGSYSDYTFYEVTAGDTRMSFYDYSGKHYADISTDALPLKNGIKVGMTKENFLFAMGIDDQNAHTADTFTINDDYGSIMSFYFVGDVLSNVIVNYEEGD
jgi:hypothetical protein